MRCVLDLKQLSAAHTLVYSSVRLGRVLSTVLQGACHYMTAALGLLLMKLTKVDVILMTYGVLPQEIIAAIGVF